MYSLCNISVTISNNCNTIPGWFVKSFMKQSNSYKTEHKLASNIRKHCHRIIQLNRKQFRRSQQAALVTRLSNFRILTRKDLPKHTWLSNKQVAVLCIENVFFVHTPRALRSQILCRLPQMLIEGVFFVTARKKNFLSRIK